MNRAVVASIGRGGRYELVEVIAEFAGSEAEQVDLLLSVVPGDTACFAAAVAETLRQAETGITVRTIRFMSRKSWHWHDAALAVASLLAIEGRSLRPDVANYPVVGKLLPSGRLAADGMSPKPPWHIGQLPGREHVGRVAETIGEIAFCMSREGLGFPSFRPVAYLVTGTSQDHLPDGWLEKHEAEGDRSAWATYPAIIPVRVALRYRMSRKVVLTEGDIALLTERARRRQIKI